ncbi:LacI family DNA-binding transcriptional regulator [Oceanobacillus sp. CFH 90083]|uniref:LacI family DNA-binding transcriptional regulator n=1 Tax=Oceanobacillus sp. CFH 90083 TaxID=2592336 RepID=UPI00128D4AB0|nr:LacI family DNA-binding transcriptional regulator [Oceanobacillus sp. CFH 90083]
MATIKEIASKSNVSIATVSRVLNNDTSLSVTSETRQRIINVANQLNYQTGRGRKRQPKKTNPTYKFGILMCQSFEEELSDPYFLSIRHGIESQCKSLHIEVNAVYRISDFDLDQLNVHLDGLIIVGKIDEILVETIHQKINQLVFVDYSPDENYFDAIVIDFEKSTWLALDHLLSLGYNNIGYIGGEQGKHIKANEKWVIDDERYLFFTKKMKELGKYNASHVLVGDFTMSDGYRLMEEAINKGSLPEACFIASDPMAVGALRALQEAGIKVPEDIAIVSFDNVEMAQFASCPLSTIHVPTDLMGKTSVKLLLDRLQGRDIPLKVTVPTTFVQRESCGAKAKEQRIQN